jgi:hypothetical protein
LLPVARIAIPTEASIPAPLLVDVTQLTALDSLLDSYAGKLKAEKQARIKEALDQTIQGEIAAGKLKEAEILKERGRLRQLLEEGPDFGRDRRSVALYLSRGRAVQAESFSEAINQPVDEQEIPTGFRCYARTGQIEVTVVLGRWTFDNDLSIEVEPSEVELAKELFGAIRNWAGDVLAPKWQRYWVKARFFVSVALLLWLFMGLLVPLTSREDVAKSARQAEARKLLASGINEGNERRALELLLAIESNYDPNPASAPVGARYWAYFALGAILLAAGSISPKVCIGVWKGRRRLKIWRTWVTTVSITVPALIFTSVVLPWVLHWLGLTPPP